MRQHLFSLKLSIEIVARLFDYELFYASIEIVIDYAEKLAK